MQCAVDDELCICKMKMCSYKKNICAFLSVLNIFMNLLKSNPSTNHPSVFVTIAVLYLYLIASLQIFNDVALVVAYK